MKKLITIITTSIMMLFSTTGCQIMTNEDNQPVIAALAKSATAQVVYATMKKNPDKYETVWTITRTVLSGINTTLTVTPEELTTKITTHISEKLNADFVMVVENALNVVFAKYKIALKDEMTNEQLIGIINTFVEAIDVGINRYKSAYETAVGSMPDQMPNDPFVQ